MQNQTISAPSISVSHASLSFHHTVLFDQLHLTLAAGKWTCLLGPSGVGKSTLLRLIAGLTSPETTVQATVSCNNEIDVTKHVAYMAQTDLLLPWMTVLENVLLGYTLRADNAYASTHKRIEESKARSLLTQAGLANTENLYPHQLSGGMRQRVAIVRTLMEDKPVILMDEPFSALDAITRFKLQNLAATLLKNRTVFFITHDPLEALRLADEIIIMSGQPATLHAPVTLTSSTPRDLSDPDVIALQATIFHELTKAHEATT